MTRLQNAGVQARQLVASSNHQPQVIVLDLAESKAELDAHFDLRDRYYFTLPLIINVDSTNEQLVRRAWELGCTDCIDATLLSDDALRFSVLKHCLRPPGVCTEFQVRLLDNLPTLIFAKDANARFLYANQALATRRRMQVEHFLGRQVAEFSGDWAAQEEELAENAELIARFDDVLRTEHHLLGQDGNAGVYHVFKRAIHTLTGPTPSVLGVATDVSERHAQQRELDKLASNDDLTGVLNRRGLERYVSKLFDSAEKEPSYCLFLIDLDGFKQVNDNYGHAVGDSLLIEFSRLLSGAVREHDGVARVGGDEFVAITRGRLSVPSIEATASRIYECARIASGMHDPPLSFRCSIGVAKCETGRTLSDLLRQADSAMYHAKRDPNAYVFDKNGPLAPLRS